MDRMEDLEAFLAIVEKGSQAAAARHLGRSLQSVGRSLTALEQGMGVELVRRTTRWSNPTEVGLAFYHRVKPAFTEIKEARLETAGRRTEPSGLLRIGAPALFAPAYVAPSVCDFMRRYPRVEVELKASDRQVGLLEEGLDVAVRIRDLPDSELRARRLGSLRVAVFGAPAYFLEHGRPGHPDDLARHQCLLRTADGDTGAWAFRIGGRRRTIRVGGRFRTDSTASMHEAAAHGLGVGRAPFWQVRDLVDRGALEVVLEEFEAPRLPVHAVWPPTKILAAKTRLFVDILAARLKREPL